MEKRTGADLILDSLVAEGVPYLFGLTGHGIIGLLEAVHERKHRIGVVSVHHESAAGFMADAYYRVAGRPVATFTSCGPGSANLVIALANAMMDSSAFLAITGNVPTSQFNRGPFQESGHYYQADFPSVVRPYVKRSFQPTRVEMLPTALRQAFALMAAARRGPIHLDVPFDLFQEHVSESVWAQGRPSRAAGATPFPVAPTGLSTAAAGGTERRDLPPQPAVTDALDMLLAAQRPLILAGRACLRPEASAALISLARGLAIPVATTPDAKGALDERDPLALGACGRNGTAPANRATRSCDVLLAVGVSFDDRTASSWMPGVTFSIPPTKLIQVDVSPEEIGRNYDVALGIGGDEGTVLARLAEAARGRAWDKDAAQQEWLEELAEAKGRWAADQVARAVSDETPIRPPRLVRDLRATLPEDAVVVGDVGVHHNWLVQSFPTYGPRTLVTTWGFGAMGFGVCGVLGAKLAAPDRPCVCVCGDGGFLMHAHAVATAVEYALPVVWVIANNGGYASIGDLQLGAFGREVAADFVHEATGAPASVDFAAMARSMGADGVLVERPDAVRPAIEAAIHSGRPSVLDVRVHRGTRPLATGGWQLPPLAPFMPTYEG